MSATMINPLFTNNILTLFSCQQYLSNLSLFPLICHSTNSPLDQINLPDYENLSCSFSTAITILRYQKEITGSDVFCSSSYQISIRKHDFSTIYLLLFLWHHQFSKIKQINESIFIILFANETYWMVWWHCLHAHFEPT